MGIDEGEVDGTILGRREAIKINSCVVVMNGGELGTRQKELLMEIQ